MSVSFKSSDMLHELWRRRHLYLGADKSLARPGRTQAAPVKSVMGRGMDWFG